MLKLLTPVVFSPSVSPFSLSESAVLLGSCFVDGIGEKMRQCGMDVCVNPFGTLYNPVSIANAVSRLESAVPFRESECVGMGAGSDLVCSFSHHTSFARGSGEEFLRDANASLEFSHLAWRRATKVIVTLGTSFCYTLKSSGEVVSNCLKRPASEFSRDFLPSERTAAILRRLVSRFPDKHFIFTVSPIRHMSDGAHANTLSKSSLLLAVDSLKDCSNVEYFPAYEIVMDELRDYRFYAEDMVHPSAQAVSYIWERFCDFAVPDPLRATLAENEKAWRRQQHRPLH